MKGSYKEHTTRETKKIQQIERRMRIMKKQKSIQTRTHKNKQSISMWNQHTYNIETPTKGEIMKKTLMNGHHQRETKNRS